jgi:Uracil-DNA glycosylase
MLESIGWQREDIFIANVVKCRPPNNRDPEPKEVETCWEYLAQQIEIIEPKLIVTLGRHSMNRFLPNLKISEAHGNPKRRKDGRIFLPLYHPAAALYSPSSKETHLADFAKIPAILKKIEEMPVGPKPPPLLQTKLV